MLNKLVLEGPYVRTILRKHLFTFFYYKTMILGFLMKITRNFFIKNFFKIVGTYGT